MWLAFVGFLGNSGRPEWMYGDPEWMCEDSADRWDIAKDNGWILVRPD